MSSKNRYDVPADLRPTWPQVARLSWAWLSQGNMNPGPFRTAGLAAAAPAGLLTLFIAVVDRTVAGREDGLIMIIRPRYLTRRTALGLFLAVLPVALVVGSLSFSGSTTLASVLCLVLLGSFAVAYFQLGGPQLATTRATLRLSRLHRPRGYYEVGSLARSPRSQTPLAVLVLARQLLDDLANHGHGLYAITRREDLAALYVRHGGFTILGRASGAIALIRPPDPTV